MPDMELSDSEVEFILRMRKPLAERLADARARAKAAKQKMIDSLKPDAKAAYLAEQERRAKLTATERQAEMLLAQKAHAERELAKPDVAAIVDAMVDGKVVVRK